ncbi:MAG TPA: MFS transporter [Alphaproteobacteria bacterium]|nr:MFS transporter [Alphaproteobacteria bacterium]
MSEAHKKRKLIDVVRELRRPKVAAMLALGFSSGLPFLLTGNTLGYWLRDEGTSLKAIGFLSWVGLAYGLKVFWSPFIDRLDAPLFGARLGRRRGWMLLAQALIGLGLFGMSILGGTGGLMALGVFALIVAFASATQDIVVDAWRIEVADDSDELGLLSAAYQLGYRAALLVTDALILISANHLGWPISYTAMAILMAVGIAATLKATEPAQADKALEEREREAPLLSLRGAFDAFIGPFISFFRSHGALALLMLLTIALYRLPEFMMGPMANPYYHDLQISKDMVGAVRASVGLIASLLGTAAGGLFILRYGIWRALILGQVLQSLAILSFGLLAFTGPDLRVFGAIMACDSFGVSFAGIALVSYMSSLTNLGYTATQYALLSSTYAMLGKFLKGFSGAIVEWLNQGHGLLASYAWFFGGCAAIGLPSLVLCALLMRAHSGGEGAPVPRPAEG